MFTNWAKTRSYFCCFCIWKKKYSNARHIMCWWISRNKKYRLLPTIYTSIDWKRLKQLNLLDKDNRFFCSVNTRRLVDSTFPYLVFFSLLWRLKTWFYMLLINFVRQMWKLVYLEVSFTTVLVAIYAISTFISSSCVIIHNKINFVEKDKERRNDDSWVLSYHAILPKP